MNDPFLRRYFIAIAGNIGAGKTTLAQRLAQQLGWRCELEPVINNPYLADFYADMSRWSFHLQVYFLSKRFESQLGIERHHQSCVQDRTIYEDAEIFARTLHARGFMSERDWENYRSLFDAMTDQLKRPDLIIYLKSDVPSLLRRIELRGREYERSIDPDYLAQLNDAYESWCGAPGGALNIATIDTGRGLGISQEEVMAEALHLLKTKLQIELPFKHA
ncbi:MAG: deoxynucleoside kinase [bacterium]|nr:deoxynucleoside kinase [bacterium]